MSPNKTYIFLVIMLLNCCSKSHQEPRATVSRALEIPNIPPLINLPDTIRTVDSIFANSSSLVVTTTYLNDTLCESCYANEARRFPIILKQELSFFKQEKLVFVKDVEVERKDVTTLKGRTMKIPFITIWRGQSIENKEHEFFYLAACGDCLGRLCPELFWIYNHDGDLVATNQKGFSELSYDAFFEKYNFNKGEVLKRDEYIKIGIPYTPKTGPQINYVEK